MNDVCIGNVNGSGDDNVTSNVDGYGGGNDGISNGTGNIMANFENKKIIIIMIMAMLMVKLVMAIINAVLE